MSVRDGFDDSKPLLIVTAALAAVTIAGAFLLGGLATHPEYQHAASKIETGCTGTFGCGAVDLLVISAAILALTIVVSFLVSVPKLGDRE